MLSMSEFVGLNTFCTYGPKLRTINQREGGGGGGGAKVYTFGKVSTLDCGRSLKCDATYQPQLKMLLLLHFLKELIQI